MKKCYKCQQRKTTLNFSKNRSKPDGLRDSCKDCDKLLKKVYVSKHKEQVRAYKNKWQSENPEKHYSYTKAWMLKKKQGCSNTYHKDYLIDKKPCYTCKSLT